MPQWQIHNVVQVLTNIVIEIQSLVSHKIQFMKSTTEHHFPRAISQRHVARLPVGHCLSVHDSVDVAFSHYLKAIQSAGVDRS
jgi:hypothetical protein